jgi:hypothetical protein
MMLQRIGPLVLTLQLLAATGVVAQVPPPFVPPTPHFNSINPTPPAGMPVAPEVPVSPGLPSGSGAIVTEPLSSGPIDTVPSGTEHKHKKIKTAQRTKSAHHRWHQPVLDDGVPRIMQ